MRLTEVLSVRNITRNRLAKDADIAPSDLYSAIKGNKPFYPAWRKRIANALGMDENDVFPEHAERVSE